MKKSIFLITGCIALQLIFTAAGLGHGIHGQVVGSAGYLVAAEYDDGEPMSYSAVKVHSPDSDIVFQTGRTDRNGRFMFMPDRNGHWKIAVEDGMGHRLALTLEVTGDSGGKKPSSPPQQTPSPRMTRTERIIMGLSIIFGIFGLCYGWKGRRSVQKRTLQGFYRK